MNELRGAAVVITGASSGIGRVTAQMFADKGARLVLAARDRSALEEAVRACERRGAEAIAVPTDIREEAQVQALREAAVARFGRIDVWVNNAAVYMMGPFERVPTEDFQMLLETNVMGMVHGAKAALAQFRAQGRGTLITSAPPARSRTRRPRPTARASMPSTPSTRRFARSWSAPRSTHASWRPPPSILRCSIMLRTTRAGGCVRCRRSIARARGAGHRALRRKAPPRGPRRQRADHHDARAAPDAVALRANHAADGRSLRPPAGVERRHARQHHPIASASTLYRGGWKDGTHEGARRLPRREPQPQLT